MALRSVMVDRARTVTREATRRVAGMSMSEPVRGEWFRCRVELPAAAETEGASATAQRGPRRPPRRPTIMVLADRATGAAPFEADQELEIRREMGRGLGPVERFRIIAAPGEIKKRRRVLAYEGTLERVEEPKQRTP